jgi:O-antigen/teichoic acid export membrane protein
MAHSVTRRFAFSLSSSLFRGGVAFATGMLLARLLGPSTYGRFAFLLGTFLALRDLVDMGGSVAFFTFLSQKPRSRKFVAWYFRWLVLQWILPTLAVALLFPKDWIRAIWKGQDLALILLAWAAVFAQSSLWKAVAEAGESRRETLRVQTMSTAVVLTHLCIILLLWTTRILSLRAIFSAMIVEYLVAAALVMRRFKYDSASQDSVDERSPIIGRKYWSYCAPMLPYVGIGFVAQFADRWVLQNYGGSIQQSYYAVASQFSVVALLATNSILRIFWKEIAEANHRADNERMYKLYRTVCRLLFFCGALVAGFAIPWAKELLRLVLGNAYTGGTVAFSIMLLYPIHQSLGQITGSFLYATEKVKISTLIGVTQMIGGIIVMYFVLAPSNEPIPGLGLGAEGLALKMVALQLVGVNVTMYVIARIWKWHFDWAYQPLSLGLWIALGWMMKVGWSVIIGRSGHMMWALAFSGASYLALSAVLLVLLPSLVGMSREELLARPRQVLQAVRATAAKV